ncbi:MAG: DUF4352 domain-containing protein [Bifidobacteriaceae bacterium]|nr:DUF4352 domain-containing protein [Bifidobacteriaceae bacterium]
MSSVKKCKNCNKENEKSAKTCAGCGAKQKNTGKTIAIVAAIVVVLTIAVSSNGNKKDKIDNSGAASVSASSAPTAGDDPSSQSSSSSSSSEESVKVGGSYEGNGLKFTVNAADTAFVVPDDTYGMYKLDSGLHYVKVDFTFENTGSSGDKYVSIYDFKCYADDSACEQKFVNSVTGDFMNTQLSPGRNKSFSTLYAVPDGAKKIELEYTSNVWTNKKIRIDLQ